MELGHISKGIPKHETKCLLHIDSPVGWRSSWSCRTTVRTSFHLIASRWLVLDPQSSYQMYHCHWNTSRWSVWDQTWRYHHNPHYAFFCNASQIGPVPVWKECLMLVLHYHSPTSPSNWSQDPMISDTTPPRYVPFDQKFQNLSN